MFINMLTTPKVNVWLCDVFEAQLKSAGQERGRLVESVLERVGKLVK